MKTFSSEFYKRSAPEVVIGSHRLRLHYKFDLSEKSKNNKGFFKYGICL